MDRMFQELSGHVEKSSSGKNVCGENCCHGRQPSVTDLTNGTLVLSVQDGYFMSLSRVKKLFNHAPDNL